MPNSQNASKMTAPVVDKKLLDAAVMPNAEGFFGEYGGAFLPPPLVPIIDEITEAYKKLKDDPKFWQGEEGSRFPFPTHDSQF